MRISLRVVLYLAVIFGSCSEAATTFQIPDSMLAQPLVLIAYGDIRFTASSETAASSPTARRALVAKIAAENPAAIFINGDLPFHSIAADYEVYRTETQLWRDKHLRVYPALGNHELSACVESSCLELRWNAFAELRGQRATDVAGERDDLARPRGSRGAHRHASSACRGSANSRTHRPQRAAE